MSGRYAPALLESLGRARRAAGASSPLIFALTYLRSHFTQPPAGFHEQLFDNLAEITTRRGARVAVAAPRGHAKSTAITLAYALWCLLYGKEPFILIVSNTADQASKLLVHIRHELETNEPLRRDFPALRAVGRVSPWRKDSILLPTGALVLSYGVGQNLRGARHRQHRPTLVVCDDLEDKDAVAHEEQREKTAGWFRGTLLKCGTPDTNVVVIGTLLHHESLLAALLDPGRSPGWTQTRLPAVIRFADRADLWQRWSAIYRREQDYREHGGPEAARAFFRDHEHAMLQGTRTLWKPAYTYYDLMEARIREGESAFAAELQNEPLDPAACIFAGAALRYWDDEHPDEQRLLAAMGEGEFFGACDPSLGADPTRGDYSAIVVLFQPLGSPVKYVIAADLARRKPNETVARILEYARMYEIERFGVEANQFQQLMVSELERRAEAKRLRIDVLEIQNRSGKQQRIAGLEAQVSQGLIRFSRRHQPLLEQLRAFPLGKYDDGPDALEMAVATANEPDRSYTVDYF